MNKDKSNEPPNVHPNDVADYLLVTLTKSGTLAEIAAAKRVSDAMQADPAVRAFVEQLEQFEEPSRHPERFQSAN